MDQCHATAQSIETRKPWLLSVASLRFILMPIRAPKNLDAATVGPNACRCVWGLISRQL